MLSPGPYPSAFPDPINQAFVVEGEIHRNIHRGWMWHVNLLQLALGSGATYDVLIGVPETTSAHLRFILTVSQSMRAELFEDADATGGSAVVARNRNRLFASTTPLVTVATAPTVTSPGTSLGPLYLSGGAGPRAPGSSLDGFEEWVLKPSGVYLFRTVNDVIPLEADFYLSLDWYEPGLF